jgi:hypothetical protein
MVLEYRRDDVSPWWFFSVLTASWAPKTKKRLPPPPAEAENDKKPLQWLLWREFIFVTPHFVEVFFS